MNTKHIDRWADPDCFDRYSGPNANDGFTPLDSRAKDLTDYLRDNLAVVPQHTTTHETVKLANGRTRQLTRRENGDWELRVHLGRDYYQITTASWEEIDERGTRPSNRIALCQ